MDPAERAREIAIRLLTHSPRSAAQLRDGLTSRDVDGDIADQVVARYQEVGLLDDTQLSATIARTRHRERGKSRRAIGMELRRKGFDTTDVEAALNQITEEDEREAAEQLAAKRWHQLANVDTDARVRRVVGMLGRRGYSPSLAFEVVKHLQRADTGGAGRD
jgi:regulatory protein